MRYLQKKYFHNLLLNILRSSFLKATIGVFVRELAPCPDQSAWPASCWQGTGPSTRETIFFQGLKWILGKAEPAGNPLTWKTGLTVLGEHSLCYNPWDKDEWSCQVGLALLELLANSRCFPDLSSWQRCPLSIVQWNPGPKTRNVCSNVSQPRGGNVSKTYGLLKNVHV